MTSSWQIAQVKKMGDTWDMKKFSNEGDTLGGWESSYMIPGGQRECHPNYTAHPIGDKYGFAICKKRTHPDGWPIDVARPPAQNPANNNGYYKYSANLYDPTALPVQVSESHDFYDRVIPEERFYHQNDYIAREVRFNGTGIEPMHTPLTSVSGGKSPYREYGDSFNTPAPPKYNVQQLHQKYPIWKQEQIFLGKMTQEQADQFDAQHNNSITSSTW